MSSTMLCLASISTLCCISADRYFAVVRPMRYKHVLTPRRATYMLTLVWFGSLSLSCLPLFAGYQYHPGTNSCLPDWHQSCGMYAFMTIAAFGVPVVILLFTYGTIFSSIRRHSKRVSHWRTSKNSLRSKATNSRVIDITANDPDSFISQSAVEEEQRNVPKVLATSHATRNVPMSSTNNLIVCQRDKPMNKDSFKKVPDAKSRSRSAGFSRLSDGNLLPFMAEVKTTKTTAGTECQRSCCVRTECSVDKIIPGTILPFCSFGQLHKPNNSIIKSRSLQLSLCDLSSNLDNDMNAKHSSHFSYLSADKPKNLQNDLSLPNLRSHSFSFTVSAAQSDVEPNLSYPAALSVKVMGHDYTSQQLHRMRSSSLSPQTRTPPEASNHLLLPPISSINQLEKLKSPDPYERPKSRSRSLSFGAVPEKSSEEPKTAALSPQNIFQMTSSPLLRLRAITQLKRKLRVSSIPREYKIAKTGFTLVLVFFLSWGPYLLVHNCHHSPKTPLWVYRTAMWLVYASCILNPIVYALSSRHIRTAFTYHLTCCRNMSRSAKWTPEGIDSR